MKEILKEIASMFVLLGYAVIQIIGALFRFVSWAAGKANDLLKKLSETLISRADSKINRQPKLWTDTKV